MGEPMVTVGMPVRNGEAHIRAGFDSLLGQAFRDLELVISDNASTDATQAICEEYAARDPRVRYHRNPEDVGLQGNFQRVLDLATAPYFMWGCPDDLWDPGYVARMVEILDGHPSVVLAGSNAGWIDQDGILRGEYDNTWMAPGSTVERAQRFIATRPGGGHATLFYGLLRTEVIQRLGYRPRGRVDDHDRGYYASDLITLFRLLFEGGFHVVGETLYFHRDSTWHAPPVRFRRLVDGRGLWRLRNVVRGVQHIHGYYRDLRAIVREQHLATAQAAALVRAAFREELAAHPAYLDSAVRRTWAPVIAGDDR